MKKKSFAAPVLLAVFTLCACQQTNPSGKLQAETDLPELKIGVAALNPFFYTDENGNYTGIDAEITIEACSRANYTPTFIEVSWSDRDDSLQDGQVDCLWSAFIKNGREDLYHWTDSYMKTNLRAIVDKKSPDQDLSTIKGHGGMAVRAGSKLEDILLNASDFPEIQIYSCGTFEMAETAFVKGYASSLGGTNLYSSKSLTTILTYTVFLMGIL